MRIKSVIIEVFKTYAYRTEIHEWDPSFNAIVGFNGHGKSNLLDAICFVLGISNLKQVRADSLNDLIYKKGQAGVIKASVALVFDNSDPATSPHGYEQYTQLTITRQLGLGGKNKYLINGSTATALRVQNLFHSVQLNIANPHFLIMQGRINQMTKMNPVETLSLIQEAAGTNMFELKKQQTVKTMEKKQTKLAEIERVFDEDLKPRLDALSTQRGEYLNFKKSEQEVESLSRFCRAHDYLSAETAQKKAAAATEESSTRQAELAASVAQAEKDRDAKKKEVTKVEERKKKESAGQMKELDKQHETLSKELVQLGAQHGQLESAIEADSAAVKGLEQTIAEVEKTSAKARADHKKAEAALQKAKAAGTEKADALKAKQEQYEANMGLASASADGAKNLQGQLSAAEAALVSHATAQKTAEMRVKHLAKEVKEAEKKVEKESKSGKSQKSGTAALEKEVASIRAQMGKLQYDEAQEAEMNGEQQKQQSEHARLSKDANSLANSLGGLEFKYSKPTPDFDRRCVKGSVAANLRVQDAAHATALEAVAGGRLHHVIVDNETTGMLLLKKGQLQRRVTLLPLNKIQPYVVQAKSVAAAKKLVGADKVDLATSLIAFEPALKPAMESVFGATLVCADKESARAICEKIGERTVTLEGDLYDPKGTLTGGSRAKSGSSVLCRLGELGELRTQLASREEALAGLAAQLETCRKAGEEFQRLQGNLSIKEHELHLATKVLEASQSHQLAANLASLKQQLDEQVAAVAAAKQAVADGTKQRDALVAELRDFEGNKDERMAQAKAAIAAADKEAKAAAKTLQTQQAKEQELALQIEDMEKEVAATRKQIEGVEQRQAEQAQQLAAKAADVDQKKAEYEAVEAQVQQRKEALGAFDDEVRELTEACEALDKLRADGVVELKDLEHRLARDQKEQQAAAASCRELLKRHPWMETEKARFGVAGGEFDFTKRKPSAVRDALGKQEAALESARKRINRTVLASLEKAEQEYSELMRKKTKVEQDKAQIEAVIAELDQKKVQALRNTWEAVNKSFESIFSTLYPSGHVKLEPQAGRPVEDGLIVRVAMGDVWKKSLTELSGGQRSLVALSLMLSMLKFKPAPIYVLDEVDAALDLSHTQNIGAMIRKEFKDAQFLVVSHKDGMFNNANAIFRVTLVNGVSQVARSVPALAKAREKAAAAAGAEHGKARQALVSKN